MNETHTADLPPLPVELPARFPDMDVATHGNRVTIKGAAALVNYTCPVCGEGFPRDALATNVYGVPVHTSRWSYREETCATRYRSQQTSAGMQTLLIAIDAQPVMNDVRDRARTVVEAEYRQAMDNYIRAHLNVIDELTARGTPPSDSYALRNHERVRTARRHALAWAWALSRLTDNDL